MQKKAKILILMVCIFFVAGITSVIGLIGLTAASSNTNSSGLQNT